MDAIDTLAERCEQLRERHVPGRPLLLPNAWDAATARAVVDAGFPVVATTSGGVAASLGYEDHEGAPGDEMLAAAARIARAVDVPVTVDAEAGYGLGPGELVDALRGVGAAGCNLEDTDHAAGRLRPVGEQADRLRSVRKAADERGYPLVINARIDVFLAYLGKDGQGEALEDGLERAHAYAAAGVDCVYPIGVGEADVVAEFLRRAPGPVNLLPHPGTPEPAELARLGAARLSWASFLFRATAQHYADSVQAIAEAGH